MDPVDACGTPWFEASPTPCWRVHRREPENRHGCGLKCLWRRAENREQDLLVLQSRGMSSRHKWRLSGGNLSQAAPCSGGYRFPRASAADREALFLEGRDRDAEQRAGTKSSAYRPTAGGAQGHQAPEFRARVLPSGRQAAHPISDRGGSEVRLHCSTLRQRVGQRRCAARRMCGNRSGFLAVLAASRLRSSGPCWRTREGLQLAASRLATLGRRCEPSGGAACRAS